MNVSLSESFLEDFASLPSGLAMKCRVILRQLRAGNLGDAVPGWRLHKLRSTRYHSISLDMNFRMLVEIGQDVLIIHRAVKHDLADSDRVNRQVPSSSVYDVTTSLLPISAIYSTAQDFGISSEQIEPLRGCETEDDLIDALLNVPTSIAEFVLSLYEISQLQIPRAKFVSLGSDDELELAASIGGESWDIYLHPSQEYLVRLPESSRTAITGSAGTGKSVCAWKRFEWLLGLGRSVGFVTSTNNSLAVLRKNLDQISNEHDVPSFFLVPRNMEELSQLAGAVDHVIIDEGQELPPTWYLSLGKVLKDPAKGLTVFSDLNQLGGNIPNNDQRRYENRFQRWQECMERIPQCSQLVLTVNYRNSREIAAHYMRFFGEALPRQFRSELPAFSGGPVTIHRTSRSKLAEQVAMIVGRLRVEFQCGEIAIIYLSLTSISGVEKELSRVGIPSDTKMVSEAVAIVNPDVARGHERKAVVVISPPVDRARRNYGATIEAYIGASRAINTLVVVEVS